MNPVPPSGLILLYPAARVISRRHGSEPFSSFGFIYEHDGRGFASHLVARTADETIARAASMRHAVLIGEMVPTTEPATPLAAVGAVAVRDALDTLALALTDTGHVWTYSERSASSGPLQSSVRASSAGCHGDWLMGFRLTPMSLALLCTAPGERLVLMPITRVGVFWPARSHSCLSAAGGPLFAGVGRGFSYVTSPQHRVESRGRLG